MVLGEGDPGFETGLAVAARKFPHRFAYRKEYDEKSAHVIEAGVDISLIPSRVEPSGLSAMYSLKYGALPVARATGGIQEIFRGLAQQRHLVPAYFVVVDVLVVFRQRLQFA